MDSDAHQLGLGFAYSVSNPWAIHYALLTIEFGLQCLQFETRQIKARAMPSCLIIVQWAHLEQQLKSSPYIRVRP